MLARHAFAPLAVLGLVCPQPVTSQVEGRYRFVLCEDMCLSTTDTAGALASGEIVFFPDSSFAADIPDPVWAELRGNSMWLIPRGSDYIPRDSDLNACFNIPQRAPNIFAGMIEHGLTSWSVQEGEITFRLYGSPDGDFWVTGTVGPTRIEGRGEQRHGMDHPPPPLAFLAEWVGFASPGSCTAG